MATFWDCHRRAFAHFAGVPGAIVYDRTKSVVKRHVAPDTAVPLHPEAAAFADHYGFVIDVLAAYRPTGKGRVERQVNIVRDHVVAGRRFDSVADLDGAFAAWLPIRRASVHRTQGQVIAVRAQPDRAPLGPLPDRPYLVTEQHLRRVGKDALISFETSWYSVPATKIRPGQRVAVQASADAVTIHSLTTDTGTGTGPALLASHTRATLRGSWVIDPAHWAGLPDGHTRAVTLDPTPHLPPTPTPTTATGSLIGQVLARHHADIPVATRPLTAYTTATNPESTDERPDHRRDPRPRHPPGTDPPDRSHHRHGHPRRNPDGLPRLVDPLLEEELGLREGRRFRNALKLSGLPTA